MDGCDCSSHRHEAQENPYTNQSRLLLSLPTHRLSDSEMGKRAQAKSPSPQRAAKKPAAANAVVAPAEAVLSKEQQKAKTKASKDLRGWLNFEGARDSPEETASKKANLNLFDSWDKAEKAAFLEAWNKTNCKKDLGFFRKYKNEVSKEKEVETHDQVVLWTRPFYHIRLGKKRCVSLGV